VTQDNPTSDDAPFIGTPQQYDDIEPAMVAYLRDFMPTGLTADDHKAIDASRERMRRRKSTLIFKVLLDEGEIRAYQEATAELEREHKARVEDIKRRRREVDATLAAIPEWPIDWREYGE
jgi:hypothetical protein